MGELWIANKIEMNKIPRMNNIHVKSRTTAVLKVDASVLEYCLREFIVLFNQSDYQEYGNMRLVLQFIFINAGPNILAAHYR